MVGTEEHLERIARDGYSVIADVIDLERAGAIISALDDLAQRFGTSPADNSFEGRSTIRVYNLLAHGAIFESIPVDPRVLPVVDGVLDRGCLVSSLSSVAIGPGETAQPIHADDQLIPIPKPHVATICNTMWALTDFTEDNGATRIIPGSHLADHSPDYGAHYDSVPAVMSAGSVLVWHGSLWHGGGSNRTDQRRVGIAMNYCAGWTRQQENQQLGIPQDLVAGFGARLQELVGYGTYSGLIGHIDRRSPRDVLLEATSSTVLWDRG